MSVWVTQQKPVPKATDWASAFLTLKFLFWRNDYVHCLRPQLSLATNRTIRKKGPAFCKWLDLDGLKSTTKSCGAISHSMRTRHWPPSTGTEMCHTRWSVQAGTVGNNPPWESIYPNPKAGLYWYKSWQYQVQWRMPVMPALRGGGRRIGRIQGHPWLRQAWVTVRSLPENKIFKSRQWWPFRTSDGNWYQKMGVTGDTGWVAVLSHMYLLSYVYHRSI